MPEPGYNPAEWRMIEKPIRTREDLIGSMDMFLAWDLNKGQEAVFNKAYENLDIAKAADVITGEVKNRENVLRGRVQYLKTMGRELPDEEYNKRLEDLKSEVEKVESALFAYLQIFDAIIAFPADSTLFSEFSRQQDIAEGLKVSLPEAINQAREFLGWPLMEVDQ